MGEIIKSRLLPPGPTQVTWDVTELGLQAGLSDHAGISPPLIQRVINEFSAPHRNTVRYMGDMHIPADYLLHFYVGLILLLKLSCSPLPAYLVEDLNMISLCLGTNVPNKYILSSHCFFWKSKLISAKEKWPKMPFLILVDLGGHFIETYATHLIGDGLWK